MTSIPIEALREMKIKDVCELVKQAERLPDNHSPQENPQSVITDGRNTIRERITEDTKTQTAQDIIDEVEGGGD